MGGGVLIYSLNKISPISHRAQAAPIRYKDKSHWQSLHGIRSGFNATRATPMQRSTQLTQRRPERKDKSSRCVRCFKRKPGLKPNCHCAS